MTPDEQLPDDELAAIEALRKDHRETKNWPLIRGDKRAGPDGYIHQCRKDGEAWPCRTSIALAALRAERAAPLDVERLARAIHSTRWEWDLNWSADEIAKVIVGEYVYLDDHDARLAEPPATGEGADLTDTPMDEYPYVAGVNVIEAEHD
jgi:hypothetical protein